ncbi:MAG: hypothetical protein HY698_19615 [Deltaproteobacteria bacterium]|nr:hypothetical protein [Deltaproteobacteria bacterium]
MTKTPAVVLVLGSLLFLGCSRQGAEGSAAAEVVESQVKLDLPTPPNFEEPQTYPDGSHSVLEMRRRGRKFLDQDVRIKGFVLWVYQCDPLVAKETPEKCERPHFLLGDTADASETKSLQVVDVPRPPREDEKRVLPKEELANWPAVPVITIGQKVVVEGKWAIRSPKGFVNSDGLLVYANLTVAN